MTKKLEKKIALREYILSVISISRQNGYGKDYDLALILANKMYNLGARIKE